MDRLHNTVNQNRIIQMNFLECEEPELSGVALFLTGADIIEPEPTQLGWSRSRLQDQDLDLFGASAGAAPQHWLCRIQFLIRTRRGDRQINSATL